MHIKHGSNANVSTAKKPWD